MANDAVHTQLQNMVNRPKAVWPGLDRMDLERKKIAGDGNCLFASLADQLYGTPTRHLEVRTAVVEHMRNFRPLFENVAIKDDLQQKRATRAATQAIRNSTGDDHFEEYLAFMSQHGAYGGEPELVAFTQCYDRDVLIHLPHVAGYRDTIPYKNHYHPEDVERKPELHLCYGGDETAGAHYDSVRRHKHIVPIMQKAKSDTRDVSPASSNSSSIANPNPPTSRAIRNSKTEISKDFMHELILRNSFDQVQGSTRTRSPSVSSSHNSTGSKRSLDEDGEPYRPIKRADRRKSTRRQANLDSTVSLPSSLNHNFRLSSGLATPASTQDSELSSDQSDRNSEIGGTTRRSRRKPASRSLTPDTSNESAKNSRKSSITLKRAISAETMISIGVPDSQTAVQA